MDKLSRALFLALCHATCVSKQLAFRARAGVVDQLVASLHGECAHADADADAGGDAGDTDRLLMFQSLPSTPEMSRRPADARRRRKVRCDCYIRTRAVPSPRA